MAHYAMPMKCSEIIADKLSAIGGYGVIEASTLFCPTPVPLQSRAN